LGNLGNKKIMAENITYYMNKHQKSRNDMCEALGVKYTTFTDWVKGNSYPRIDKIELMANYFGISKADLVEKRNSTSTKSGVTINVLGRVAAGIPIDCVEEIIDTEEITQDMASTGEFFGLQIHGDSMEPRMKDGDVVIVRQQDDAETDNIVIAVVNGNEATCKRLKKYAEGIALISTNPSYEPMYFSNKEIAEKPVRIIGVVKELRAKF
jgi:repressor LexA